MRPPALVLGALHFIGIPDIFFHSRILFNNAFGKFTDDERDYLPASELHEAIFWARVHMAVYALAAVWTMFTWSLIPLVLIGGPRIYGTWHMVLTGLLQHGGLAEDVLDHRLNSRTVYMNPVSRFIYWNMNYHVEHHMFPMVPYHALPALHEKIKDDLPIPKTSILSAYMEMVRALWRQRREPGYTILPILPPTARPFKTDFQAAVPERAREDAR